MWLNRDNIKEILESDRAMLVICIGIAFVLWLFLKLSLTYTLTIPLKVEYSTPSKKTYPQSLPSTTEIVMEATGWEFLFSVKPQKTIIIPLRENNVITSNFVTTQIKNSLSSSPSKLWNIKIQENLSSFLQNVRLTQLSDKKVPLRLQQSITFKPPFELIDSISMRPTFVTLSGPDSLLRKINSVRTNWLILENIQTYEVSKKIGLEKIPSPLITDIDSISVFLKADKFTEKIFTIPINVINQRDSVLLMQKTATLICRVGLNDYDKITPKDFSLQVNLKNMANGSTNTAPILLKKTSPLAKDVQFYPPAAEFYFLR